MCFQLLCNAISHRSSSRESSRWAAVCSRCSCRSCHLDTCWCWRPNSHPRNRRQAVVRETCCAAASSQGHRQCLRKNALFLNFSYVCPEPVLAKCSFLNRNGSQKAISARFPPVFRTGGAVTSALCRADCVDHRTVCRVHGVSHAEERTLQGGNATTHAYERMHS
jgi:hypothetical protein